MDALRRAHYTPSAVAALEDNPECLTHDFQTLHAQDRHRYVNAARFREAVTLHQPQAVLGAVLSREWGARGASRKARAASRSEEISRLEALLDNRRLQETERTSIQMRIDHLRACIAASLPDQVLNTNIAGPMADRDFPYHERLTSELDPSYWAPE